MKDKRGNVKIKYFVSNALVYSGMIFGKVFEQDIHDKFQKEHNRPIPKWIDLHYISLKRFEQWLASKEMNFEQLIAFDGYLQYMVPAADLMTDEMHEFYNWKLDKRLLYDESIENNE